MYVNELKGLGFTENEASVYLVLLEYGDSIVSVVARRAKLVRSTVYTVLSALIKKGAISSYIKRGVKYYVAISPDFLTDIYQSRVDRFKEIIPDLRNSISSVSRKPEMRVFEGKEGLIRIMEDTLTVSNKELYVWANMEVAVNTTLKDYYPQYVKKKVEANIWVRGIFMDGPTARLFRSRGKDELREIYLLSAIDYPFSNEINIYDDKVAIIAHEEEIGVIIQNKAIADTQKMIFKFGFESLKRAL